MCEVENIEGGYHFVPLADGNCADHVQLTTSTDGFDCDWECSQGWYVGKTSATAQHCFLPVPPTLSVVGGGTIYREATDDDNTMYTDAGAECFEDALHCDTAEECDISDRVTVSGDVVDLSTYGTYTIQYMCTSIAVDRDGDPVCVHTDDANACRVTTAEPRVVIVRDTTCPTCAFTAQSEPAVVTIEASFPYDPSDLSPKCSDNCGFDSSSTTCAASTDGATASVYASAVDVEAIGPYLVTYSVADGQGNTLNTGACSAGPVRTVQVIDSLKPIIGLNFGANTNDHVIHDGGNLGEHDSTGSHPKYGVDMAKSGYADKTKHPNPAATASFWNTSFMSQVVSVNAWFVGAVVSAVAGVAVLTLTTSKSSDVAELV